jgi:hypothetical protein
MADILHEAGIQTDAESLRKALTEASGLQGWWSEDSVVEGQGVGSVATITFYGGMAQFKLKVSELDEGKVVWEVIGGPPDWMGTTISWELISSNGQPAVYLAHRGFASTEGNFASVNYNWGWYLTSMKRYLEEGTGTPHTGS